MLLFGLLLLLQASSSGAFAGEGYVEVPGGDLCHELAGTPSHWSTELPPIDFKLPFLITYHNDTSVTQVKGKYMIPQIYFDLNIPFIFAVYLDNQLSWITYPNSDQDATGVFTVVDDDLEMRGENELREFCFAVLDRETRTFMMLWSLQLREFRGLDPTVGSRQYYPLLREERILRKSWRGNPTFVAVGTVPTVAPLTEMGWTGLLFTFELSSLGSDAIELVSIDDKFFDDAAFAEKAFSTLSDRPKRHTDLLYIDTASCLPLTIEKIVAATWPSEVHIVFPGGIPLGIYFGVKLRRGVEPRTKVVRESMFHGCSLSELIRILVPLGVCACNQALWAGSQWIRVGDMQPSRTHRGGPERL